MPRSRPSPVPGQKEEESLGALPVKKEAETALTHMRVVPLGSVWREKMSLPYLCIPLQWVGKAQGVGIGEWLGREEQEMFCKMLGLSFLLSSSKEAT